MGALKPPKAPEPPLQIRPESIEPDLEDVASRRDAAERRRRGRDSLRIPDPATSVPSDTGLSIR